MKRQRVIRKFPTGKPPNSESENPGAVGTATGAEVQSVLERTSQIYRKPDPNVQFAALDTEPPVFCERRNAHVRRRYDLRQAGARPLTRSGRAILSRWVRRVKELVRAGHRVKHDDHLVSSDAEALVDYPTLASYGWTSGTPGITVEIEATTPTFDSQRLSPLTKARNAERCHDPLVSRLR